LPILFSCRNTFMDVTLYRALAVFNLLLCSALVCDTFLLKPVTVTEVFQLYRSTESRTVHLSSHWTNFIVCSSGNRYRETQNTDHDLQSGEEFYVVKSFIFKRPIELRYRQKSGILVTRCGALNEENVVLIVPVYIILISLLLLWKPTVFNNSNVNERLIFSATALLLVVIFFYFTS
jgi:hypothetical protein